MCRVFAIHYLDLLLAILDHIVDVDSLVWVDHQHLVDDVEQLRRVPGAAQGRVISFYDLLKEIV